MSLKFQQIKILKDKVVLKMASSLEIEEDNDEPSSTVQSKGKFETNLPASEKMNEAMADFQDDVIKFMDIAPEDKDRVTVQGITIQSKNDLIGLQLHYKQDLKTCKGSHNAVSPAKWQHSAFDDDELPDGEEDFYLDKEIIEKMNNLITATDNFLKNSPKQLDLFKNQLDDGNGLDEEVEPVKELEEAAVE